MTSRFHASSSRGRSESAPAASRSLPVTTPPQSVGVAFYSRLLLVVAVCALLASSAAAGGGGLCEGGCQNGGKLVMPNSVFGYCRCRCPPDFKGPKCQFIDKRAGPPLGSGGDDDDDVEDAATGRISVSGDTERLVEMLRRLADVKAGTGSNGYRDVSVDTRE